MLATARDIADWICNVQKPWVDVLPDAGNIPFSCNERGWTMPAPEWNYAFAIMGLLAAEKTFDDEKYAQVADRLAKVLKTFQIFDEFNKEHYGAIREHSPLCPWCYTRDAISAGWGFIELYKATGDEEYKQRALLFAKWLEKKGLDDEGYPWFGVTFEKEFRPNDFDHIKNDIQGSFQGGSLNFFYQLFKMTENEHWVKLMKPIADIFVDHIQQDSGYFVGIYRDSKKTVCSDNEYSLLHRGNDDLGTLGLLGMYEVTGDKKYLEAIRKFLQAVWSNLREDGFFEDSVAASPVILNATYHASSFIEMDFLSDEKFITALQALNNAQCKLKDIAHLNGALLEHVSIPDEVTMRANCYALIFLLKISSDQNDSIS